MSEKKKSTGRKKPEQVIRSGEVTGNIRRRQSTSGYAFLVLELEREWMSVSTGRVFHGANFFERHEEDLIKVVQESVAWMRRQANPVTSNEPPLQNGSAGAHEDRFPESQESPNA